MGETRPAADNVAQASDTISTSVDNALTAQMSAKPWVTVPIAAGIACCVVCALGVVMWSAASWQGPRLRTLPSDLGVPRTTPNLRKQWLQDVLAAQKQFEQHDIWDPVARSRKTRQTQPRLQQAPVDKPSVHRTQQQTAASPDSDALYTTMFGSPARFAQANALPSVRQGRAAVAAAGGSRYRGTILQAHMQSELSSDPTGAPTVAILQRSAALGALVLPMGTEVHGIVRGTSVAGARVFVDFTFMRLPSGATYDIAAVAQDVSGRAGLPGKRHMTRATAGSIGLASVGRAVHAAGREFAGTAGRVVGAGVEGAADSGSDKAQRLDRDESVVVVQRGTALRIYLTDASLD